jgi:hypothetical protein
MLSMKKVVCTALLVVALLCFGSVGIAEAHPGRTDANAGHTCRTNCESWGLGYGEYHSHGGGGGSTGQSTYAAPAVEANEPEFSQEFLEHRNAVLSATPTKLPTKTPTRIPTKRPTPTVTLTLSPTTQPTTTILPTKKVQPLQLNVATQKQKGFFEWLFRLLGLR